MQLTHFKVSPVYHRTTGPQHHRTKTEQQKTDKRRGFHFSLILFRFVSSRFAFIHVSQFNSKNQQKLITTWPWLVTCSLKCCRQVQFRRVYVAYT